MYVARVVKETRLYWFSTRILENFFSFSRFLDSRESKKLEKFDITTKMPNRQPWSWHRNAPSPTLKEGFFRRWNSKKFLVHDTWTKNMVLVFFFLHQLKNTFHHLQKYCTTPKNISPPPIEFSPPPKIIAHLNSDSPDIFLIFGYLPTPFNYFDMLDSIF